MKITMWRIMWVVGCALSASGAMAGCGSENDDEVDSGAVVEPDTCLNAGQAETGCMCAGKTKMGSRTCGDDLVWGACACPDNLELNKCTPGQELKCSNTCPGDTEGRIIECLDNGTYDCVCPGVDAGAQSDSAVTELDAGDDPTTDDAGI